jgi:hypothetical protein
MSYLVVLVLDNPDLCQNILEAWEATGVRGITILESTGVGRMKQAGFRDDIPLMPNLSDLFKSSETHHRTLFSVVETAEQADGLRDATETITGELSQPNTGLMFVVELHKVFGETK